MHVVSFDFQSDVTSCGRHIRLKPLWVGRHEPVGSCRYLLGQQCCQPAQYCRKRLNCYDTDAARSVGECPKICGKAVPAVLSVLGDHG
jgi:hypothetical protein